jgi:nickel-type superoxide dismutase maturation protease
MFPLLQPGEEVLVDINFKGRNYFPKIGDIVVLNHPEKSSFPIIKRVVKIKETGEFFVQGDNFTVSNDSRHFGTVNSQLIIGKVVCRFA